MEQAYQILYTTALSLLGLLLFVCLARAVIGPTVADRIVAVNMIGTITIMIIAILTLMLDAGYLADIALIYAMLSFLAVVLLSKIYIGIHLAKKSGEEKTNV